MNVICMEDSAFYALIESVVSRIKEQQAIKEDRWITGEAAMIKLNVKSKTTLQQLRDQGKIRYTQPQKKLILYDSESINEYLSAHAKNTF